MELELRKLLGHSERLKDRPDKEISELSSMSIVKEMISKLSHVKNRFGKSVLPEDKTFVRPIVTENNTCEEIYGHFN